MLLLYIKGKRKARKNIKEYKTTEAQRRAIENYRKRNPEQTKINRYRSTAKTFIRHYASEEDFQALIKIFNEENPNSKKAKNK